ncbi:MAG: acyl-CoA synthetase [Steroidobacteraceae bacterium]|jgi:predicted LPLAT superfamily acyltransferase
MTADPSRFLEPRRIAEQVERQSDQGRPAEWIRYRERGSQWLLRLMAYLSLRLGRRLTRVVLYGIAAYFFLFSPRALRHSRRYLRLALGRPATVLDRFRHVLYFATCIHDRVYLVNEQYERFDCTVEGDAFMQAQLQAARGAFLMGAHLGSFEVMASIGRRRQGLQVSMAMYEDNARKINAMLAAIGHRARPDIIPLGQIDAMLRIADRLDSGAFVGVLGDRTLGEEPVHRVSLLGREAWLPTGPMRAAAILRRPVIFMAGLYRGGNRYHVVFEPIADFSNISARDREAEVHRAIERYAGLLDRYCRSDAFNWFNFFDFWRAPPDKTGS